MATDRLRYVNLASSSGGDGTTNATSGGNRAYAAIRAALAAEFALVPDLVAADVRLIFECTGGSDFATSGLAMPAFTTSASCYILIRAVGAAAANGVFDAARYAIASNQSTCLSAVCAHTRFQNLQVHNSASGTSLGTGLVASSPSVGFTITAENVVFHRTGRSGAVTGGDAISVGGAIVKSVRAINCVFSGAWYDAVVCQYASAGSANVISSCTVIGAEGAFNFGSGANSTLRLHNNRVERRSGSSRAEYILPAVVVSASNMSSDTTSPQTGLRSVTGVFADAVNYNYRPAKGDAGIGAGVDLSADSGLPFSTDASGIARTVPWDIGALALIAFPGPSLAAIAYYRRELGGLTE